MLRPGRPAPPARRRRCAGSTTEASSTFHHSPIGPTSRGLGVYRAESSAHQPVGNPVVHEESVMLISTANDLPGYEITEVLGEVFGLTVRSRNIGAQFGAGLK